MLLSRRDLQVFVLHFLQIRLLFELLWLKRLLLLGLLFLLVGYHGLLLNLWDDIHLLGCSRLATTPTLGLYFGLSWLRLSRLLNLWLLILWLLDRCWCTFGVIRVGFGDLLDSRFAPTLLGLVFRLLFLFIGRLLGSSFIFGFPVKFLVISLVIFLRCSRFASALALGCRFGCFV